MAEVEVVNLRIVGLLHAIAGVGGEPAPGGDIDFAPVVHRPTAGLGLPATLPACRDARDAAHRHEDCSLHATIPAAAGEAPLGEARQHAVFMLGVPGDVGADPVEDLAGLD